MLRGQVIGFRVQGSRCWGLGCEGLGLRKHLPLFEGHARAAPERALVPAFRGRQPHEVIRHHSASEKVPPAGHRSSVPPGTPTDRGQRRGSNPVLADVQHCTVPCVAAADFSRAARSHAFGATRPRKEGRHLLDWPAAVPRTYQPAKGSQTRRPRSTACPACDIHDRSSRPPESGAWRGHSSGVGGAHPSTPPSRNGPENDTSRS